MELSKKEITYLSHYIREQNSLSLFSSVQEKPDGTESQNLKKKGIIQNDQLTPEASQMLGVVASPNQCSRMLFYHGLLSIEIYTYKCKDKLVFVASNGSGYSFNTADSITEAVQALSNFTGYSLFTTTEILLELTHGEALVLGSMLDIWRRYALLAYIGEDVSFSPITFSQVNDACQNITDGGITSFLTEICGVQSLNTEAIKNALEHLVSKEYVTGKDKYSLSSYLSIFAKNFLVIDNIIICDTFCLTDGEEIDYASHAWISAGMHNILSCINTGSGLVMSSVSSAVVLETIEEILQCPPLITPQINVEERSSEKASPADDSKRFCSQCGHAVPTSARFCSSCGSKL